MAMTPADLRAESLVLRVAMGGRSASQALAELNEMGRCQFCGRPHKECRLDGQGICDRKPVGA